eukprot:8644-Pyramimonas_sp.AAC.1
MQVRTERRRQCHRSRTARPAAGRCAGVPTDARGRTGSAPRGRPTARGGGATPGRRSGGAARPVKSWRATTASSGRTRRWPGPD